MASFWVVPRSLKSKQYCFEEGVHPENVDVSASKTVSCTVQNKNHLLCVGVKQVLHDHFSLNAQFSAKNKNKCPIHSTPI